MERITNYHKPGKAIMNQETASSSDDKEINNAVPKGQTPDTLSEGNNGSENNPHDTYEQCAANLQSIYNMDTSINRKI